MTLIIAYAGHDGQFLVADRRISDHISGRVFDDQSYKILNYVNIPQHYQFSVAYTGLAEWNNFRTIDWLIANLPRHLKNDTDVGKGINSFALGCTNQFKQMHSLALQHKALTLILCGRYNLYGSHPTARKHIPFLCMISNCMERDGRQSNVVSPEFTILENHIRQPSDYMIVCRGDLASASRHSKTFILTRRIMRWTKVSIQFKVRLAMRYIRKVASNSITVGEDVLAIAYPKKGFAEGFEFPKNEKKATRTMPHMVSSGGAVLTNFLVGPVKKEGIP